MRREAEGAGGGVGQGEWEEHVEEDVDLVETIGGVVIREGGWRDVMGVRGVGGSRLVFPLRDQQPN